jgi:hypothetical protein
LVIITGKLIRAEATHAWARQATVTRPRERVVLGPTRVALSRRDDAIITAARERIGAGQASFGDVTRALIESTEQFIAGGKIFHLGVGTFGPILGSIVSGVGIAQEEDGVVLVRVGTDGRVVVFDRFRR